MPSPIFSSDTFPPYFTNPEAFAARYKKILTVSREKYSLARKTVEWRIHKEMEEIEKLEEQWEKKKEAYKEKEKEEKAKKHAQLLEKQAKMRADRETQEADEAKK